MLLLLLACTPDPVHVDWDASCNPMATGTDCLTPFPSSYWMDADADSPTGVVTAYDNAAWSSPDGELPVDLDMFNGFDGVSPATPAVVALGADVDPSFLYGWGDQQASVQGGAAIALIDVETGALVPVQAEMDRNNRDGYAGRHALIVRPLAPMAFGHRHAVLLTQDLRDVDGNAFTSPPVFEALRDDVLTDSDVIEDMRPEYEDVFAAATDAGWAREDLLLAWTFQVASEREVLGPILSMKAQALDAAVPTLVVDETFEQDDVQIVRGTFAPPNFLNADNEIEWDGDTVALQTTAPTYDYTIAIPLAEPAGPRPLILIGHGLFGNGRSMIENATVQTLATELDAVLVATDWIGLSSGDRDLILGEVLPNLSRVGLVTDRLAQSHVNNLTLVEAMLQGAAGIELDDQRVWYYGISLGGIQGTSQVAISDRIDRAVVAVPGAGWAGMIQRSVHFEQLDEVLDLVYGDPLGQTVFLGMLQSRFDRSDPAAIGTLLRDQDKVLILQEAIGDCQVPNNATDLLSRSVGAVQLGPPTDPVYGLEEVAGPVTQPALTQIRVPDDLDVYFPPDENITPEMDNGVHNSAVLQPAMYEQIRTLFETGEAVHPCDGACDPD